LTLTTLTKQQEDSHMSIIGKAIAQAVKTIGKETKKPTEKPTSKPKANPKPTTSAPVENSGSPGKVEVKKTTSTSGDKPTSTGTSTLANAIDFAVGEIQFNRAADDEEREVKPGDLPSSFEVGDLDYYLEREADFEARHPDKEVPDYYSEYGDRYINEFAELSPDLSEDGQEWVAETRVNLQQAFEDRIADDPEAFDLLEQDPEALRDFAFDTHSDAYLEAGFANLPPEDLLQIASTPTFEDFLSNLAIREAVEVGVQAAVQNPSLVAEVPAQVLEEINSYISDNVIEVTDQVAGGFGDLSNSALDGAGDLIETGGDIVGGILPGPVGDFVENGTDNVDSVLDAAGGEVEQLFDFFGDTFGGILGSSTDGSNFLIDAFGGLVGSQIEGPIRWWDANVFDLDGPAETAGDLLGQGVEFGGDVLDGAQDLGGDVLDAGGNLIEGGGNLIGSGLSAIGF
jgi:hypothetical protein